MKNIQIYSTIITKTYKIYMGRVGFILLTVQFLGWVIHWCNLIQMHILLTIFLQDFFIGLIKLIKGSVPVGFVIDILRVQICLLFSLVMTRNLNNEPSGSKWYLLLI